MSRKLPKIIRQIIVLIVGIPIIIVGIILIPLPGPGWLIVLSGLYIISREFKWARTYIDYIEKKLRQVAEKIKARQNSPKGEGQKK